MIGEERNCCSAAMVELLPIAELDAIVFNW
jgi:hypothetical protein